MLFLLCSHLSFLTVLSEYLNVFDIFRLLQAIKMCNADLSVSFNTHKFTVKRLRFLFSVGTIIFTTFTTCFDICWGTRWRSWLRHCATSQKVASSIPDGVIGIFHWHNPSGRTKALGSTQTLTEISTRNISWGVKADDTYGWQLYHLQVSTVLKSGSLNPLEPSGPVQAHNGIIFF